MPEEMGQVLEMAGILARVAKARAATGREEEAVMILASVIADQASERPLLAEESSIGDAATELMDQVGTELDPETLARAKALGTAKSIEVTTKELLA